MKKNRDVNITDKYKEAREKKAFYCLNKIINCFVEKIFLISQSNRRVRGKHIL